MISMFPDAECVPEWIFSIEVTWLPVDEVLEWTVELASQFINDRSTRKVEPISVYSGPITESRNLISQKAIYIYRRSRLRLTLWACLLFFERIYPLCAFPLNRMEDLRASWSNSELWDATAIKDSHLPHGIGDRIAINAIAIQPFGAIDLVLAWRVE